MPTTNSPKSDIVPVRFTAAQRRQIDELVAAGFGPQADVIRTAVDRMHQQEIAMSTVSVKQANDVDHENAYYVTLKENGLTEKFVAWTGKDGKGLWVDYGAGAKQIEGRAQFSAGTNAGTAIRNYFTRKQ